MYQVGPLSAIEISVCYRGRTIAFYFHKMKTSKHSSFRPLSPPRFVVKEKKKKSLKVLQAQNYGGSSNSGATQV